MIFSYFLLAHLLADFVFQPAKLVQWKMKSMLGTLVHVLIHFVVSAIILLPFILNGYHWLLLIIAGITTVHFIIDQAKINYDLKHDQKVKPFIIDQLLHLLTILIAFEFIRDKEFILPNTNSFYEFYANTDIITFLSFIVVVSTVVEVFNFQKKREKNDNAKLKINSDQVLGRIIVFTVIYAFSMILSFYFS